ncbi:sensor histidine kinase [Petropleomorpha daqingensis]|uniref:histidine kinase n=1 Tax=Petropleomorpha daqingensis TaxID=2026353 RepID=A0A853CL89_9ACTN|nr:signal transduction histidine kinase [Petropleomorpha daqingensis]
MKRALVVLACLALVTLAVEVTDAPHPVLGIGLAVGYTLLATVGFLWVERQRRWALSAAYVLVQVLLGYAVFGYGGAGVGATLLLCVLVSQAVLLLPLPVAVVLALAVPLVHLGMSPGAFVRNGLGVLAAAVFTAVVTELLRREQRSRAELATAHEQLRGYAAQAEELATTQERNRVARDIHDGLGHHLTVVQMQVQAARAVLGTDPDRADAVLARAQDSATEALAEVRRSVAALRAERPRPPLRTSLEGLAAEASAAGIPTELRVTGDVRPLPADAEESLFRAAQEALTNVRKHAEAGSATVVLDFRGPATVRLEVCDDGRGLVARGSGFGLVGIRERAAQLGGRLDVTSAPGGGTTLLVEVPG